MGRGKEEGKCGVSGSVERKWGEGRRSGERVGEGRGIGCGEREGRGGEGVGACRDLLGLLVGDALDGSDGSSRRVRHTLHRVESCFAQLTHVRLSHTQRLRTTLALYMVREVERSRGRH